MGRAVVLGNASKLGLEPSSRMQAGTVPGRVMITTYEATMRRIAGRIARTLLALATLALLLGAQSAGLLAQTTIFADGFESGDLSEWF